jgi:DNA-directed RNA polymerase II subunit RPB7
VVNWSPPLASARAPPAPNLPTCLPAGRVKMFFIKELEKTITLHPSYFGPQIRMHIHRELLSKEEGSNTGTFTVVCILDSFDISDGQVVPGSGAAEYTVHYKAIVWRPFKGEVVRESCP